MGYLDFSDADMIALTRQKRREARERRLAAIPPPLRFSGVSVEFSKHIAPPGRGGMRRKSAARSWRNREWERGNRCCHYCLHQTIKKSKKQDHPLLMTVDHRVPISRGGIDGAQNWVVCCWQCNNRKGSLSDVEFRQVMAFQRLPRLRLTG